MVWFTIGEWFLTAMKMKYSSLEKGIAYHESGHAIVAYFYKKSLVTIAILSDNKSDGVCSYEGVHPVELQQKGVCFEGPERWRYLCHSIMISLAGEVAQTMFCKESAGPHQNQIDRANVQMLIDEWGKYLTQGEKEDKIEQLTNHTKELIENPLYTAATHSLAAALLEKKTLQVEQVEEVIDRAIRKEAAVEKVVVLCPHCEFDKENQE
jgi:hypothetical protein